MPKKIVPATFGSSGSIEIQRWPGETVALVTMGPIQNVPFNIEDLVEALTGALEEPAPAAEKPAPAPRKSKKSSED